MHLLSSPYDTNLHDETLEGPGFIGGSFQGDLKRLVIQLLHVDVVGGHRGLWRGAVLRGQVVARASRGPTGPAERARKLYQATTR